MRCVPLLLLELLLTLFQLVLTSKEYMSTCVCSHSPAVLI